MEALPLYISVLFILTSLLTLAMLYKASQRSKPFITGVLLWLIVQGIVSLSGFYKFTKGQPPRFAFLLVPPVVFIIILLLTPPGRRFTGRMNMKLLTLLHVVRIPVELSLYWLFLYKAVPQVMTFEGRNFDILCGLTAPLVYYFGYVKKVLSRTVLIAWNMICLALLLNIVITAVLSAPFAFQKFAFDQPNIALFYFPFSWLPCFVVPAVLLAHAVVLIRLIKNREVY
jgi:hypothetical protein